jgi:hypothetical protein
LLNVRWQITLSTSYSTSSSSGTNNDVTKEQ